MGKASNSKKNKEKEPLPAGMTSMGDLSKLKPEELEDMIAEQNGVMWVKHPIEDKLMKPVVHVRGLGKIELGYRPASQFAPTERDMVLMYFTDMVSELLFQVPKYEFIDADEGVKVQANLDFALLPCWNPEPVKGIAVKEGEELVTTDSTESNPEYTEEVKYGDDYNRDIAEVADEDHEKT